MTPTEVAVRRIKTLIQDGARVHFLDGRSSIALQDVEWIPEKGLMFAMLGTVDASGVHLIRAAKAAVGDGLDPDSANEIVLMDRIGETVALIYPSEEADRPVSPGSTWADFWESQRRQVSSPSWI